MKAPPLVAAPLDGVTVQLTPVYTSKEAWFSLADYHVRYRRWLVMLVTSESTSARISPFSRSIPLASFVSRALRESLPLWDLDFLWFFCCFDCFAGMTVVDGCSDALVARGRRLRLERIGVAEGECLDLYSFWILEEIVVEETFDIEDENRILRLRIWIQRLLFIDS